MSAGAAAWVGPLVVDLAAPFRVASALSFPPPAYLLTGGREAEGDLSGPINAPRAEGAFFTRPEFRRGQNDGRLYYQRFRLVNPHDPFIPEESAWFVCWQPAGASDGRAQRLFARPGYDIDEIETDGKRLLLRLSPAYGSKKTIPVTDRYLWNGDALGQGRFVPEGAPTVNRRIPLSPPNAFSLQRDRGYACLSRSDWAGADAAFRAALALRPADAACWFALGVAREGRGVTSGSGSATLSAAIDAYSRAIAHQPARTPAYVRRARLYVLQKQYDRAIADLTQVVRQAPRDVAGYTERAAVYVEKGDYSRAAADARKAAMLEPAASAPLTLLADCLYRGGHDAEAVATAQRALKRDGADSGARLILAYVYARQNRTEKAKQQIIAARESGMGFSERQTALAEVRRLLKATPNSPALKAVQDLLRGPEGL